MNIYVGNLDTEVTEKQLKELFEAYGDVSSTKIIADKYSQVSKGFGFVTMENNEDANNAVQELNGTTISKNEIVVNEARHRKTNFYR